MSRVEDFMAQFSFLKYSGYIKCGVWGIDEDMEARTWNRCERRRDVVSGIYHTAEHILIIHQYEGIRVNYYYYFFFKYDIIIFHHRHTEKHNIYYILVDAATVMRVYNSGMGN